MHFVEVFSAAGIVDAGWKIQIIVWLVGQTTGAQRTFLGYVKNFLNIFIF